MCTGCASPSKGAKSAVGGSSSGSSPFAKYIGGGDSNRGYEQAGKGILYASDVSVSPIDRYALVRELRLPGVYKPASPMERYTPPKPASDSFLGMDALYSAARRVPMLRPPSVETELEQRENRKKKFLH
ncbi:MAG: hypothetical protein QT00_C0002G0032 [archaeon GW2011_AR5]|nr:MAG: hypothetical protein QT00_C0002G0032 [archaeon GW2011_AR5]